MRWMWLSVVLAVSACGTEGASSPAEPEIVSAGELPSDAAAWLASGRDGELADGEQYDLVLPVLRDDGTWSDEAVTLTWNDESQRIDPVNLACPLGSTPLGVATGTASVSACSPMAAVAAAQAAALAAQASSCNAKAVVACSNLGATGNAIGTPVVTSNVSTAGACPTNYPLHVGWVATATVTGTCCSSCTTLF